VCSMEIKVLGGARAGMAAWQLSPDVGKFEKDKRRGGGEGQKQGKRKKLKNMKRRKLASKKKERKKF